MTTTIKDLREEYKALYGKNPFNGWNEDKLLEKIAAKKNSSPILENEEQKTISWEMELTPEQLEEKKNMEEARKINSMQYRTVYDKLIPVHINGEPFALVNDKYIPFAEAEIIAQKELIEHEKAKLEGLQKGISLSEQNLKQTQYNFVNPTTSKRIEQNLI